jgi:hypothetical protein
MKFSQTIHLDKNDDIAAVIDKISQADTPEVILAIPQDAEVLSSVVNLKLLKREADILNKHLVILTDDKAGRHLVQRAGIESGKAGRMEEKEEEIVPQREVPERAAQRSSAGETGVAKRVVADIIIPVRRLDQIQKEEQPQEDIVPEDIQEPVIPQETAEIAEPMAGEFYPQGQHFQEPPAERQTLVEDFWAHGQQAEQPRVYHKPPAKEMEFFAAQENPKKRKFFVLPQFKKLVPAFIVAGIAVFVVAAYFVLPRAKITITPKAEASNYEMSVVADKNINKVDYSLKKIPAQLVKIGKKESKEFEATGSGSGNQKARGIISVYNNYSTAPQTLVATTRFVAKDSGRLFRISKTIIVPGAKMEAGKLVASSIDAEVAADQAGADYNIGPTEFTIPGFQGTPKYSGFFGKSKNSMSGGSSGAGAKIILAEDQESAKKILEQELKAGAAESLKEQISSNLKLFEGASKEGEPEITFSHPVGAATEKFTGTISAQIIALAFDPKYIVDLIKANSGSQAAPDEKNINYGNWKVDFDKGQISMDLDISVEGASLINIADLKKKLAGKNEADIRKILSQTVSVQNAKITLWPFWVKEIPNQTNKIEITIEQSK